MSYQEQAEDPVNDVFDEKKALDILRKMDYEKQTGGPLKIVFDEKKAVEVLKKYTPLLFRKGGCSCEDSRCPHKSDISPLGSFFLKRELDGCLKPTVGFLTAFQDIKRNSSQNVLEFSESTRIEINPELPEHSIHDNMFNPGFKNNCYYRVKINGRRDAERELIPRNFIEIIEGIELSDEKVKSVIFMFNDIPYFTFSMKEGKSYYEFPFPIILRCLQYVLVNIIFIDENKNKIFPKYNLIGGYYNGLDWISYKESYPFVHLGKQYKVFYNSGIFSIQPYVNTIEL